MINFLESRVAHEDIQPIDILCGRDKLCYNHIGKQFRISLKCSSNLDSENSQMKLSDNRRLRFLVAFNLERYKSSRSRKAKGKVVLSILKQIDIIGGCFLERDHGSIGFWLPASRSLVRQKISHALRDKNPLPELNGTIPRLKILSENLSWSNLQAEHYFDEINASLLRAKLPEKDCFNDQCVEDILMEEIEICINTYIAKLHYSPFLVIDDRNENVINLNPFGLSFVKTSNTSNTLGLSSRNGIMVDQDEELHLTPESVLCNITKKPRYKGYSFALENAVCDPYAENHSFSKGLRQSEFERTALCFKDEIFSLGEDLPQNFSETEFECLVASLDTVANDFGSSK